ncbi:MAG: hypothetical protein ACTSVL_11940 [Promethearchaeota archaeon]
MNNFIVKKLPPIPKMEDVYNVKIDHEEFIINRENLLKLKQEIEKNLE